MYERKSSLFFLLDYVMNKSTQFSPSQYGSTAALNGYSQKGSRAVKLWREREERCLITWHKFPPTTSERFESCHGCPYQPERGTEHDVSTFSPFLLRLIQEIVHPVVSRGLSRHRGTFIEARRPSRRWRAVNLCHVWAARALTFTSWEQVKWRYRHSVTWFYRRRQNPTALVWMDKCHFQSWQQYDNIVSTEIKSCTDFL